MHKSSFCGIFLQALLSPYHSNTQQGVSEEGARILCHASWGGTEASAFLVPVKKMDAEKNWSLLNSLK